MWLNHEYIKTLRLWEITQLLLELYPLMDSTFKATESFFTHPVFYALVRE